MSADARTRPSPSLGMIPRLLSNGIPRSEKPGRAWDLYPMLRKAREAWRVVVLVVPEAEGRETLAVGECGSEEAWRMVFAKVREERRC